MWKSLLSGFVGACALTILHETARQFIADAPRVDVLGERALAATMKAAGKKAPAEEDLYAEALIGDIVSNSLYYSLVGWGNSENALTRGALLGLAAGAGAVYLPDKIGLGFAPSARTPQTVAMTVAWYTVGGIAAGLVYDALANRPTVYSSNYDDQ